MAEWKTYAVDPDKLHREINPEGRFCICFLLFIVYMSEKCALNPGDDIPTWGWRVLNLGQDIPTWVWRVLNPGDDIPIWVRRVLNPGQDIPTWVWCVLILGQTFPTWVRHVLILGQTFPTWGRLVRVLACTDTVAKTSLPDARQATVTQDHRLRKHGHDNLWAMHMEMRVRRPLVDAGWTVLL